MTLSRLSVKYISLLLFLCLTTGLHAQELGNCALYVYYTAITLESVSLKLSLIPPEGLIERDIDIVTGYAIMPVVSSDRNRLAVVNNTTLHPQIIILDNFQFQPVLRELTTMPFDAELMPDWSPDGTKIAFDIRDGDNAEIVIADVSTGEITLIAPSPTADLFPTWSPDGKSIAFASEREGLSDIFIYNLEDQSLRNLTNTSEPEAVPDWSPDGETILFVSRGLLGDQFYTINIMTRKIRQLTYFPSQLQSPRWSRDGKQIIFASRFDTNADWNIYMMDANGGNLRQLTDDPGDEIYPSFGHCEPEVNEIETPVSDD